LYNDGVEGVDSECVYIGWDVLCPGLTAMMQREKGWEDETGHFEWVAEEGLNGWGDPAFYLQWTASPKKLFTTFYAMSRGWPDQVWPRAIDGVNDEEEEVPMEVRSHVESSIAVHSTCRC
jgi:hypothetical protein